MWWTVSLVSGFSRLSLFFIFVIMWVNLNRSKRFFPTLFLHKNAAMYEQDSFLAHTPGNIYHHSVSMSFDFIMLMQR